MKILRIIFIASIILSFWQGTIWILELPTYILPTPSLVWRAIHNHYPTILWHSQVTMIEAILGLCCGILVGSVSALAMSQFIPIQWLLKPVLVISQALPVFAIAPLLVLWFGYGIVSKVIICTLMVYFPVTSAFYDGLQRTPVAWIELASIMNAEKYRNYWHIRVPAAMPALASGIRVATVMAPIGAVIGEWVGSNAGLGYLILNANARMQIDEMFACLLVLVILSLSLYDAVDSLIIRMIPWKN